MSKNDQHIFFNLLRAKDSKLLYIFLAYLISFILTAIFKTTYFEITTFALLAIIAIWAMSREHKDKKTYAHLPLSHYYRIIKKGRILYFQAIDNDKNNIAIATTLFYARDAYLESQRRKAQQCRN